jgi:Putative zinc-finger
MNCGHDERQLALFAGGDLEFADARRVESHVAGCPDCRAVVVELRESGRALRLLKDEPLDTSALVDIRRQVLAQIPVRRRLWWWPVPVAAAALLIVMLLPKSDQVRQVNVASGPARPAPVVSRKGGDDRSLTVAARAEHVAAALRPASVPRRSGSDARHRLAAAPGVVQAARPKQEPVLVAKHEPLLIKLLTDDPDVVIYLQVD